LRRHGCRSSGSNRQSSGLNGSESNSDGNSPDYREGNLQDCAENGADGDSGHSGPDGPLDSGAGKRPSNRRSDGPDSEENNGQDGGENNRENDLEGNGQSNLDDNSGGSPGDEGGDFRESSLVNRE